jgi:hypothetical protein
VRRYIDIVFGGPPEPGFRSAVAPFLPTFVARPFAIVIALSHDAQVFATDEPTIVKPYVAARCDPTAHAVVALNALVRNDAAWLGVSGAREQRDGQRRENGHDK